MPLKPLLKLWLVRNPTLLQELIFPAITLLIFFPLALKDYFFFPPSTLFGIVMLPLVVGIKNEQEKSIRYLPVTVFFLLLAFIAPLSTLLYIAWISAFLLVIENSLGKTSLFSFVYLIIISPAFTYVGNFIGIPARLVLTQWAGNILNAVGFQNQVAGNLILTPANEFSVDPACMGLNMLTISFILAILIALHYSKENKKLNLFFTILYLAIALFFNLIGNLARIILLVFFNIPPEDPLHEIVGIICLVVYVLLPIWFVATLFYKHISTNQSTKSSSPVKFVNIFAIFFFCLAGCFIKQKLIHAPDLISDCNIEGYKKTMLMKNIFRFEDECCLVYVKPVNSFYGAEHTPMICWVGNGYAFKQVKQITIKGHTIFVGKIMKGTEIIFCSWWFDNGYDKTINQLDWRWKVIKGGQPYSLINVNALDEKMLLTKTSEIISKNIFYKN